MVTEMSVAVSVMADRDNFMKIILIHLFMVLIIMVSCSAEPEYMSEGTIIGGDARMCMCCGGWYIKIMNDTLRFGNLPDKSNIYLNDETFPIKVRLNWKKDPNACLGDEIIILQIEKN